MTTVIRPANAAVRAALGLPARWEPVAEHGETETRVGMWSVRELQDVYARVGGTVTARQVERTLSDGDTYTTVEVTVTAEIPGAGAVQAFTDWDPAEPHGFDLPVIGALTAPRPTPAVLASRPRVTRPARVVRDAPPAPGTRAAVAIGRVLAATAGW